MARKKRIDSELVLGTGKNIAKKTSLIDMTATIYNVALYARLSVEDSGKIDGYSLENQIALLKNYIADKEDLRLFKLYVDNGESGVNFERPAFNEMMADMRGGKINCIIVKDLSRLGRNYLEAGQYIEQIFPFFHVRFISVMDHYDSISASALDDSMLIPLKNIINDSYAKDISKKVSSAMDVRMKKGIYLGNYPPYGYRKDPKDSGHLVIDDNVADVVKQIFQWKAEGVSNNKIAKMLNDTEVLAPFRYFYSIGLLKTERHKESLWTGIMVRRLLQKRYYIGDMVSGKERTSLVEGIKRKRQDEEDWIIVEGTHEPLVNKELFYAVQAKIEEDKNNYGMKRYEDFNVENLFKGKLRCGKCGSAMKMTKVQAKTRKGTVIKRVEYICTKYAEHKFEQCKEVKISKEELDDAIFGELKAHIMIFANTEQIIKLLNNTPKISEIYTDYEKQIQMRQNRLVKIESLNCGIYEDFKEEIIDEKEYLLLRKSYSEEAVVLKRQIEELEREKKKYSPKFSLEGKHRELIEKYFEVTTLTKEFIDSFIDGGTVFNDKRIKIKYKFQDEFEEIIEELDKRKGESINGECGKNVGFSKALCYWDIHSSFQRG